MRTTYYVDTQHLFMLLTSQYKLNFWGIVLTLFMHVKRSSLSRTCIHVASKMDEWHLLHVRSLPCFNPLFFQGLVKGKTSVWVSEPTVAKEPYKTCYGISSIFRLWTYWTFVFVFVTSLCLSRAIYCATHYAWSVFLSFTLEHTGQSLNVECCWTSCMCSWV